MAQSSGNHTLPHIWKAWALTPKPLWSARVRVFYFYFTCPALTLNDVDLEMMDRDDYQRVFMSLAAAACEMADVDHTRCLNALDIPFNRCGGQIPELGMLYKLRPLIFVPELAANFATGWYLTFIVPSGGARRTIETPRSTASLSNWASQSCPHLARSTPHMSTPMGTGLSFLSRKDTKRWFALSRKRN